MSDWWLRKQVDKFAFDFDQADKDKNGVLSCDEVVAILKTAGFDGTDDEAKAIFTHLDLNKDNKITKDEFKDAIWRLPKFSLVEFGLRNAFKTMDKDQTGSVTKKELQDYFATDNGSHIEKEKVDKILKYLEIEDDDGQVHYDEFLRLLDFEESSSVLHQIFTKLDKDGSGVLSVDEIQEAVKSEGQLRKLRSRIVKLLDNMTSENPGKKIDFHQFLTIWNKK